MPAFLLRQRRDFQQGLLQWLRGSEAGDQMRRVISDIEAAILCRRNVRSGGRPALVVATQTGMVEPSTALKQLLARIDLQVRRFVEGPRVSRTACAVKCSITLPVRATATRWLTKSRICTNLMFWCRSACRARLMWLRCNRQSNALGAIVGRCKDAWTSLNAGRGNALYEVARSHRRIAGRMRRTAHAGVSSLGRGIANAAMSVGEGKVIGDDLPLSSRPA